MNRDPARPGIIRPWAGRGRRLGRIDRRVLAGEGQVDSEAFYLLDGAAQLLSGDQVVTAERGDLVIVPPGLAHAFAAAPGEDADILIVITPGVQRFEYFRHLERISYGKVPPQSLLEVQELYDTYFRSSPAWDAARPTGLAGR
ncbi:cupin domain-containing protein [Micromonospora sp. CPCC 205739]|uniref:cupin domain-containing protein n=1 Tax=Micromonospora sp. CPCC 205739 TaxID=3122404 RepID=UPI002FEE895D